MNKVYLVIILLIYCNTKAQTIKGTIFHKGETVPFCSIIIRKDNNDAVFQYTNTNKLGYYQITLKEPLDSVWVEVNSIAYEFQRKYLKDIQKNKQTIILDFNLENRLTELEEIVIKKEAPITVKNDTTTYNPDSFKDGTERVVEDLLKKLPGIKVEDNGEIKYKGKSIKKFLLDGDDLFGNQYTSGSRNISIDMIDKVQAIDNFNENEMLKGLVNSEDVAINLQLKKGKTDLSGDTFLSYGIKDRYKTSVTGLFVNKIAKGFLVTGYNNIGDNTSPYNFTSETISLGQINERLQHTATIIGQGNFHSQLTNRYHQINNNLYSELNFLTKISSNISLKTNIGVYDDRLTRTNKSYTEYSINEQQFVINEIEKIVKKPRLYNANFQLNNKVSDSLKWEYSGKVNYQYIKFNSNSSNNEVLQKSKVITSNFFTNHHLNFTNRINKNSAVMGSILYSYNRAPQEFVLNPGLNVEKNNYNEVISNYQSSRFDKRTFILNTEYYLSYNDFKWKLYSGYKSVNNQLKSILITNYKEDLYYTDKGFQNDMIYKYDIPNIALSLSYIKKEKFGFGFLFNTQYYNVILSDLIRSFNIEDKNLVVSPVFKFLYILNTQSNLIASYSFNEIAPSEINLFEGVVLTGFRSFRNNTPNLSFLDTHTYNLTYNYNDIFKIKRLLIGLNHTSRSNNYFSKSIINLENTFSNSFMLDVGSKDYSLNLDIEHYIHFIRTTLQLNSSYTMSFDKNIINDSDLRNIESRYLFLNCILRTGFKSKFNIENKISYFNHEFLLDEKEQNQYSSINNTSKLIYKIGYDFKADITYNFISPDLSKNNNYSFLDAAIRYTPQKNNFQYSLIMKNLTNISKFETVSISDYSRSISSHNLIKRYIMGSISFKF